MPVTAQTFSHLLTMLMHMLKSRHQQLLRGYSWGLVCLLALSACGGPVIPPSLESQQNRFVMQMDQAGYLRDSQVSFERIEQSWQYGQQSIDVQVLMPATSSPCPLVIYMPGLGENAGAGQVWRETWVKAGYAVLSFQSQSVAQALKELESKYPKRPDMDDEDDEFGLKDSANNEGFLSGSLFGEAKQRPSLMGRNSELRYMGFQYFAVEALQTRLEQLRWVVSQLKSARSTGALAQLDLSKIILAGYDLGAQTVAAAIGERHEALKELALDFKPIAAILLSPSVNLAKGHVNSRFQSINVPLLVITGADDNDPYAISAASTRQLIWQYAAPGQKYLLTLDRARHRLFSGWDWGGRSLTRMPDHAGFNDESDYLQSSRRRMSASDLYAGDTAGLFGKTRAHFPELGYKNVAAVASVSAAFMDLQVKNDEFARFWITQKADHWLRPVAELKVR